MYFYNQNVEAKYNWKAFSFVAFLFLLFSCKTLPLRKHGDINDVILNSINDFRSKNNNLLKKDAVFHVLVDEEYEFYRIIIVGKSSKYLYNPEIEPSRNKLPNGVYEIEDRLFIWYDSTKTVTSKTIEILKKYNLLVDNEGGKIWYLENGIDDSKRGANYFVCKSDFSKFKKVISNWVPECNKCLKCNQD